MSARLGALPPLALLMAAVACAGSRDPSLHDVLVHYESRRVDELDAEGLRIDWQAVSGKLRVGNVVPRRSEPPVSAPPPAERERESERESLRMLEGESGRIATDVGAPIATRALIPYRVREAISFDDEAEAGFDVTPHVLSDGRVRLELTPFDERFGPPGEGGPQAARPAPAATVTVAPGARVAIGGLAHESTASGGSGFSSIGRPEVREERVLVVWVEVE